MSDKNKKVLLIGVGVVLLVLIGWVIFQKSGGLNQLGEESGIARGMAGDPMDIVLDYYNDWQGARFSTSTNPVAEGLLDSPAISQSLADTLAGLLAAATPESVDPVLCQNEFSRKQRAKTVFMQDTQAQILILPISEQVGSQATFTLGKDEAENWSITDIVCSSGEQAPAMGEFTFERDGFLLHNIPAPQNPNAWYLVFTEAGTPGHTVELLLNQDSQCVDDSGQQSVCSSDTFVDAEPVYVQGNLTESGLEVKRITHK